MKRFSKEKKKKKDSNTCKLHQTVHGSTQNQHKKKLNNLCITVRFETKHVLKN